MHCASTTTQWGRDGCPHHLKPSGEGGFEEALSELDVCPSERGGDNDLVSDSHRKNLKQEVKTWLRGEG